MKEKSAIEQTFQEIAICLKPLLREAHGEVGVFLVEKNGVCAAIIVADKDSVDQEHLSRALKLFQKRLGEMAAHTEVNMDMSGEIYIREEETGEYQKPGEEESPGFAN